jgi:HEAT repeat protein
MIIDKNDVSERARAEAILQLGRSSDNSAEFAWAPGQRASATRTVGDEEDAAFLRGLYGKTDSRMVKAAILSSVARIGGSTNEQWLLGIAKNRTEETSLRKEAISRIKTSSLSIEELGKLFDALSERELRYAVVSQLASRDDPAAVDKLIEIARSGTDPQVRRQAIAALAQKKDPRTMKLLLELVEKP